MKWKYLVLIGISGFLVSLDQLTKLLIYTQYKLGESTVVIPNFFNITYVRNYGAAFGFLSDAPPFFRDNFFLIVPVIALGLILYIIKELPDNEKVQLVCYSSIFGGAIGNYIDRHNLGYVVDFLDFHYKSKWSYPAFNVADMSIVCGVLCLILLTLLEKKSNSPVDPSKMNKASKDNKQLSA